MENIDKAKNFFKNDRFATERVGIEILEASENYAKCKLEVTPSHLNASGFVMGGALFTLADFTFGVAINDQNKTTVTLQSATNFINGAKSGTLYATAECLKRGRKISFYEVTIVNEKNIVIANCTINGYTVTK